MRLLIQRVKEASVSVEGKITGAIGQGLLVLVGFEQADDKEDIEWGVSKLLQLRIFDDQNGVMNLSLMDIGGNILAVSQFTLHALTKKGNRPSYIRAARPEIAEPLYEDFCARIATVSGVAPQRGIFGAEMAVSLINDGPVTIWIDTKNKE